MRFCSIVQKTSNYLDKKKLELVQAKNTADASLHSVKKSLTEYGDKLEAGEKEKIEAALKARSPGWRARAGAL